MRCQLPSKKPVMVRISFKPYLKVPDGDLGQSGVLRTQRRSGQLLGGRTAVGPDAGGRESKRGLAGEEPRDAPVPPKHAEVDPHRVRGTLPIGRSRTPRRPPV